MGSTVAIRDVESIDEIRTVEDLEKEVWVLEDRDITPLTQLVAARASGGQLIGAFDGQTMIGFVYGFIGLDHGQTVHHSHMLAVKPAYRNADVGYRLKLAQRERVLAQGITRITWTFDPLQSLNAYFNFCKLGVVSDAYKINFYGEETSSFLHRIGTDRLWLTWIVDSQRVRRRLEARPQKTQEVRSEERPLVEVDGSGWPRELDTNTRLSGARAFIEIPADINVLQRQNPEQAVAWRNATRRAFSEALASGFLVEGFFRRSRGQQPAGVYVLSRGRTIEDFA